MFIEGRGSMSLFKRASTWSFWRKLRVPRVRIADASDGVVVKLVGRVSAAGQLLRSPLGGRECVCFEAAVYTYTESYSDHLEGGGRFFSWEESGREGKSIDFVLEEETGCALVRAAGWLTTPSIESSIRDFGPLDVLPSEVEAFLKRHRLRSDPSVDRAPYRASESVIAPGDRIEVLGAVRWERDLTAGGYREVRRRLVIEVPPDGPLVARHEPDAA